MAQVTLQRPQYAYLRGAVRPWEEAVLHISSEAVLRSANVYEGMKGYWQPDGTFALVHLRRHYDRLTRSARLLHLPVPVSYGEFEQAIFALVEALLTRERDMWVRANLFAVEGHWGLDTVCDLMMTAFHQDPVDPAPIAIGVSTWVRPPDLALPARVKTTANYQVGRLARIEGRGRGYGEMILMNSQGRVAEATGSCVLMARDDEVHTPPSTEGTLESITLDCAEAICRTLDIPFQRRPIDRAELVIADELAVCGTLAEITEVTAIDEQQLPRRGGLLTRVASQYLEAVRGVRPHPEIELTTVPGSKAITDQQ
jgi:branched-chain amino acid aminotransferase